MVFNINTKTSECRGFGVSYLEDYFDVRVLCFQLFFEAMQKWSDEAMKQWNNEAMQKLVKVDWFLGIWCKSVNFCLFCQHLIKMLNEQSK